MEQRTKIRRNLLYQLDHPLQQTLKQNTKPSKKETKNYIPKKETKKLYIGIYSGRGREREQEREHWGFREREELRENLNFQPNIFPGTKHYKLYKKHENPPNLPPLKNRDESGKMIFVSQWQLSLKPQKIGGDQMRQGKSRGVDERLQLRLCE